MEAKNSVVSEEQRMALRERPVGRRPAMFQRWRDLLFLHWKYDAEAVQATLPEGLTVDTYEGSAYVAIVPFLMREVRPRGLPAVPWISNFLEMNVRTYVYDESGIPGVWFYSLEANRRLAVEVARWRFKLPYFFSRMSVEKGEFIDYRSRRSGDTVGSRYVYGGAGGEREAAPGSLEFFLIERYALYARDAKQRCLKRGRVYHAPYRIQDVEVREWDGHPLVRAGLSPHAGEPDLACYAEGVSVEVYGLEAATRR